MEHTQLCRLSRCPERIPEAARWFHRRWGIPEAAYQEEHGAILPGTPGAPVVPGAGRGAHRGWPGRDRKRFPPPHRPGPNVCAVYTEPDCRGRGLAGQLLGLACAELAAEGITTLYLLTDHTGFYERYGWEFFCTVQQEGEPQPTRVYRHRAAPTGKQE